MTRRRASLLLAGIILFSRIPAAWAAPQTVPSAPSFEERSSGEVQDVSDQKYLGKAREVISTSSSQLDLALAQLSLGESIKDAVRALLEHLVAAKQRGVKVRLFLNTFSTDSLETLPFLRDDKLEELRREGIEIHFVNPRYAFSGQLLIADERVVLEGGPAWNHEALTQARSSAVLIESPTLARKKRVRLELLPLWDLQTQHSAHIEGEIAVPLYLLQDVQYFPAMLKYDDGDAFRIYLVLLQQYFEEKKKVLTLDFSNLVPHLPAGDTRNQGLVSHQVYEALTRLERNYELVQIISDEPNRMQIEMKLPEKLGAVIHLPLGYLHEHYLKNLSLRASTAYLILLYRLQTSGRSPVWVGTDTSVEQDFPLPSEQFREGVKELRKENLIEVFPFTLRQGERYQGFDEHASRYLINDLLTLSERLEVWSQMREHFGEDDFRRAKSMAELFGEPEDPKVVTVYLSLLTQYARPDIESFTQHVAQLSAASTPSRLEYLKSLLQNETQTTSGLAVS